MKKAKVRKALKEAHKAARDRLRAAELAVQDAVGVRDRVERLQMQLVNSDPTSEELEEIYGEATDIKEGEIERTC